MDELYKPGSDNNPAGEYEEVSADGQKAQSARQVSINKGDKLPPTQTAGNAWRKIS